MIGHRAVFGLSLLIALAFSAIVATGASAETKTTTAFRCVKNIVPEGPGFSKEHCATGDSVSEKASYRQVEIASGSPTTFEAFNQKTESSTIGGINAALTIHFILKGTITAKKVLVDGDLENFTDPMTNAMYIKQRKVVITFSEVTLTGKLAEVESCKIAKGEIVTNELEAISLVNTMEAEYSGPEGIIAVIKFEGCKNKEFNEKGFALSGTFRAIGDGATVETTTASTSGLKFFGNAATLTSKVTPWIVNPITKIIENPVSATTISDS
jgi:hypothetical protein